MLLLITLLSAGSQSCAGPAETSELDAVRPGIEVLALSRGRGVPEATREALQMMKARLDEALVRGSVVAIEESVVGLEGETRMCVLFRDQEALETIGAELRKTADSIDLLQVRINACSNQ